MLTVVCLRGGRLWMVTTPAPPWTGIRWQTLHLSQFRFHNRNIYIYVLRVLFSKTRSAENPSSTSQAVTTMLPVQGEGKCCEKIFLKKKIFRSMSRASSLSSEFGHTEVNLKFICEGNGNMHISGSYCHTFCPNSGQFKDS